MTHSIPDAALANHCAILGKTGSGKTSTAKLAVEQVVDKGFRVCILDAIKSDWWGITSSANGKKPGLPFQILGGPRGHVPLHSSAGKVIGGLVGSGALPLSIIDMADFEAGGLQKFFNDFAPALMRSMKGVVYLVIEEAHEFAPKERPGISKGAENVAIHYAKKLATAGRSKGIRLIVATQSIQSLHNSVLGSCETVIAHRLTTPAHQKPVKDWLAAQADKETMQRVADSLASLPTGTGWVCSGEAKIFEQIAFPKFRTYDNTATPTGDSGDDAVATAAVDCNALRALIGDAIKDAEANDPKALKAEIARLNKEVAAAKNVGKPAATDPKIIMAAEERGFEKGIAAAKRIFDPLFAAQQAAVIAMNAVGDRLGDMHDFFGKTPAPTQTQSALSRAIPAPARPPQRAPDTSPAAAAATNGRLPGPQQRILNSLATWKRMGHDEPSNAQVAWLARYSPKSTGYTNPRSALKTAGLIEYPSSGSVALTAAGLAAAIAEDMPNLRQFVLEKLKGPERRILQAAIDKYPKEGSNEEIATAAKYSPSSTGYTNPRSALKTKELIDYPRSGFVKAADWLFPEGEHND